MKTNQIKSNEMKTDLMADHFATVDDEWNDRYLLASYISVARYIFSGTVGNFRCSDWKHIPSLEDERKAKMSDQIALIRFDWKNAIQWY